MNTSKQLAKHLKEFYFGDNWTASTLKETLIDVTWQEATAKVYDLNTITALVYHIGYYVTAVLKVLNGGPLDAHDKYSFDHPSISSDEDWKKLLEDTWKDADDLIHSIEKMEDKKLWDLLSEEKHGNYFRNFLGIIEHSHYHLGQIVLIKKILKRSH